MFDDRDELIVKAIFWQPRQPDGTGGCLSLEVEGIGKRYLRFWLDLDPEKVAEFAQGNPVLAPVPTVCTEQGWVLRKEFTQQIWPAETLRGDKSRG